MENNQLRDLLALSYTRRWAINPTHREQSVAEHSFRVTMIAWYLLDHLRHRSANRTVDGHHLLLDCLTHDAEEVHTGDMPSTDKHSTGVVPPLSDNSMRIRKVADSIETYSFWCHWGNHNIPVPHNPLSNPQGQWETKRVLAYTDDWPELRTAAAEVCKILCVHMEGVNH